MNNKPDLTWPMVALFGICVAGIIVSHAFAPTSAAAVVSLVSTATGFVFGFSALRKQNADKDKSAEEAPKDGGK